MKIKKESEAEEAKYPTERAAKDSERQLAQRQGRKPPRHDAGGIAAIARELMRGKSHGYTDT